MTDILSTIGNAVSTITGDASKAATTISSTAKTAAAASATAAKTAADSPEMKKLKEAAKQFEAVFLRQMIGAMRSSSLGDGIMDSSATQQFRDMGDSKLADDMAGKGALHVADMLVKQYGARLAGQAAATTAAAKTSGSSQ